MLRRFTAGDLEPLLGVFGDAEVMRYVGAERRPLDRERRRGSARRRPRLHWSAHGFGLLAVVDRATGRLIGEAGLQELEAGPDVEVGYTLGSGAWGRGYATEAATAVLRWGFAGLRLPRIDRGDRPCQQRLAARAGQARHDAAGDARLLRRPHGRVRAVPHRMAGARRTGGSAPLTLLPCPRPQRRPGGRGARERLYSRGDTARFSPPAAPRPAPRFSPAAPALSRSCRPRSRGCGSAAAASGRTWRCVSGSTRSNRCRRRTFSCSPRARSRARARRRAAATASPAAHRLTGTVFDGNWGATSATPCGAWAGTTW